MMTIICAWCLKIIGEKDAKGVPGIGHGMCPECSERLMNEYLTKLAQEDPRR